MLISENIISMILLKLRLTGGYGIKSVGRDSLDFKAISILDMKELSFASEKPYSYGVIGIFSKQDPEDVTRMIHKKFRVNL